MTGTGKQIIVLARARARAAVAVAVVGVVVLSGLVAQALATPQAHRPRALIWSGSFANGTLAHWLWVQACPHSISVVRDPAIAGAAAVRITVTDHDLHSFCPRLQAGPDPSAFLVSPSVLRPGATDYIGFSVLFPRGFPAVFYPHWLQVAEIYGPPFRGSPQISVGVSGNRLALILLLGPRHHYTVVWSTPLRRGSWHRLVLRLKLSADPRVGFVQLWHNGARQRFGRRRRTVHMQTLAPGLTWNAPRGRNALYLDLYRAPGLGSVTVYEGDARIGRTYWSVAW